MPPATTATGAEVPVLGRDSATAPAPLHPSLVPLVQQQLDALATQNFAWQGQVWPGQQMHWEIEAEPEGRSAPGEDEAARWRTRLALNLPRLGGVEAVLSLRGGDIELSIAADSDGSRRQLVAAGDSLGRQLADAGLRLAAFTVSHGEPET